MTLETAAALTYIQKVWLRVPPFALWTTRLRVCPSLNLATSCESAGWLFIECLYSAAAANRPISSSVSDLTNVSTVCCIRTSPSPG